MGLVRVNFFIDPTVLKGLQWLAETRGTTVSEIVRMSCKEYVVREIRVEMDNIKVLAAAAST